MYHFHTFTLAGLAYTSVGSEVCSVTMLVQQDTPELKKLLLKVQLCVNQTFI